MPASLRSRIYLAARRLVLGLLASCLICGGIFLLGAMLDRAKDTISSAGGDTVLHLGSLKLVLREEPLATFAEKWQMLCRASRAILPPLLPEAVGELFGAIQSAFFPAGG